MRLGFLDTLFTRLFVLMWAALVLSHAAAFTTVRTLLAPPHVGDASGHDAGLPPLPSLPPLGGEAAGPGAGPPPLPGHALWLDLALRAAFIGVFAAWGARWLAAPMRRLAAASEGLGRGLSQPHSPAPLDEHHGTLEVRRAAAVFNTMARQLQRQFRDQDLLMASISHDLRTPLARLRLRLETLPGEPQAQRGIADIAEMDTLIGSVLDAVRGRHDATPAMPIDLVALLQAMVDDLADQGHAASFAAPAQARVQVTAQPAALRRIVGNLIGNALRHGGSAALSIVLEPTRATLRVDDRGPGIAPDRLAAVFQPFKRGSGAPGGAGLGLYIARDLAERLGAVLTLANRPEGGLRAELVLPRS